MNEKEKMLAGELYDVNYNEDLFIERCKCKDLCKKYNDLQSSNIEERTNLIKQILGKTGERIMIEPNFWCDYGYNISVGENFYMNHNCTILDPAKVEFGDNVTIGAGSVVTKDIPSNVVAYGNPCKVVKDI